ncbi:putative ADP-ribosylation factor GTPase-activating protein AGD14 [Iris pallida]|uniref:ADP-ribosylation factor GTPase-activating protein AGD14 n=1 Tax=Iris pallida TaxID=29817 RepID=A0AAX6HW91_IRIPA|nr:putative ADP-ribosylation factor GTPase-activating protein AGD14 [Iris pallida]
MRGRMKEDEKNEKIIRGLLKLPQNKRCINCNNLGPQYVCTNFWTFICTNCSGIHREFCHRVKSISMAKFTSQEVSALQEGGNERAKDIYFKDWDPQRHSVVDSSNIDRLRDLIKHVYVDRRYSGERSTDRPPRTKPDNPNESSRGDSSRGDSRSPPYDDHFKERLGGRDDERNFRFLQGERSPGYNQGDGKRNPRHFEVVDNRQREDRFGNGNQNRRFEDRRLPDVVKPEGSSPTRQKDFSTSSPPTVRPVKDILGDDMPQLRVGDIPKSNGILVPNIPAQTQRTSSSSSMGSSDGNSAQVKTVNDVSLIDFSADPEPSFGAASQPSAAQTTAAAPQQSVLQTTSLPSNAGDWASFDVVNPHNVPQAVATASTLGSSTAPLSAPGPTSMVNSSVLPISGVDSSPNSNIGGKWSTMQHHQPSLFPAGDSRSTIPTQNTNFSIAVTLAPRFTTVTKLTRTFDFINCSSFSTCGQASSGDKYRIFITIVFGGIQA